MPDYATDQKMKCAEMLTIDSATFTGSYQSLGVLLHAPVVMTIQNDSNVTVTVSDDGTTNWKPFIAGERMVLDSRANSGNADNMAFPINTRFWVKGAAGAGNFIIAYIYAQ